ncbi:paraquat-inducible protein A [Breoghania sp.]|nr:paraquat-inducible protein A [Breoghania sp.]
MLPGKARTDFRSPAILAPAACLCQTKRPPRDAAPAPFTDGRPMRLVLALLLPIATFSFALGITLPLIVFKKLYFFTETPSLVQIVLGLERDGDRGLAFLVGGFSIVLPAVKLVLLHTVALGGRGHFLHLLGAVSKWSMMDVMVVALVVFAAKSSGLATAITQPGLWFYATATVATAAAALLCRSR